MLQVLRGEDAHALCASQSDFRWARPVFVPSPSSHDHTMPEIHLHLWPIAYLLPYISERVKVLFWFISFGAAPWAPTFTTLGSKNNSLPLLETHGGRACFIEILTRHSFLKKYFCPSQLWGCVKALPNTSFDVKPKALAIFFKKALKLDHNISTHTTKKTHWLCKTHFIILWHMSSFLLTINEDPGK